MVTANSTDGGLTAQQVRQALAGAAPERIRHDAVRVDGRTYPIKQAYALATGQGRDDFTADAARRQLSTLGFEIVPARRAAGGRGAAPARGGAAPARDVASARGPAPGRDRQGGPEPAPEPAPDPAAAWHLRESLQDVLMDHLTATGWTITPGPDSAARERDVVAVKDQDAAVAQVVIAQVTGYPAPRDAGPAHPGLHQPGQPSPLAVTWFAQAVLAALRTRSRQPSARSVIALPAAPAYEELYAEVTGSLAASGVEVWWLDKRGDVQVA